jgi:hypothetical protein
MHESGYFLLFDRIESGNQRRKKKKKKKEKEDEIAHNFNVCVIRV